MKPTHFNAFMQVILQSRFLFFLRSAFVLNTGQSVCWVNMIFLKMSGLELRSTNGMPNCCRILLLFFRSEPEFADIGWPLRQPPCEWMAKA